MFTVTIHSSELHRHYAHDSTSMRIGTSSVSDFGHDWHLENVDLQIESPAEHGSCVVISNLADPVELPWHEDQVTRGSQITTSLPVLIRSGTTLIEIRSGRGSHSPRPMRRIARSQEPTDVPRIPTELLGESPSSKTIARWLESLDRLQREASGSKLINKALRAVTETGGLDSCLLLTKVDGVWQIKASHVPHPSLGIGFSTQILETVLGERVTVFHERPEPSQGLNTLSDSIVAAPIIGPTEQVDAILYGVRSVHGNNSRKRIRPLEAVWVQLVAGAIAAGSIRHQAEANAARTRVVFEQAFSSKVASELVDNPDILVGRELEISVLFADLREFSSIAERLGTRDSYEFLGELLEHLTDCVMQEGGVIIDYYGDGLAAMWNAPTTQVDHAERACRAALSMLDGLPAVSNRWRSKLEKELRIGIGINTGMAQVGNAGTSRRLKYGPRGTTVNIASRVETATKMVGAPILVSGSTFRQLPENALAPRLGCAHLKGISEPVDLHQLMTFDRISLAEDAFARIDKYQKALALYENGDLEAALSIVESTTPQAQEYPSAETFCDRFLYEYINSNDGSDLDSVFDLTGNR